MVAALCIRSEVECLGDYVGRFDSLSGVVVELAPLARLGDA